MEFHEMKGETCMLLLIGMLIVSTVCVHSLLFFGGFQNMSCVEPQTMIKTKAENCKMKPKIWQMQHKQNG